MKGGIKEWPQAERPRERLIAQGADRLSDAQLLAIVLRTGRTRQSAIDLAIALLDRFPSLGAMARASVAELVSVPGVGPAKAAQLKAALELGRRLNGERLNSGLRIGTSADVFRHYQPLLKGLKREVFKAVLLDGRHRVLREVTISEGSLSLNIVHPREAFNPAVRDSAAAVIYLHNHPSGDPTPSAEDRELTRRLVSCGELLGIRVLDHLIIGEEAYFSFADRGEMGTGRGSG